MKTKHQIFLFFIGWIFFFVLVITTYYYTLVMQEETTFLTNFDFWIQIAFIPYNVIGITYIATKKLFTTIKMLVVIELALNFLYDWTYIFIFYLLGTPPFENIDQVRVPYGFYAFEISYLQYLFISILLFILGLFTYKFMTKYYQLAISFTFLLLGVVPMGVVYMTHRLPEWVIFIIEKVLSNGEIDLSIFTMDFMSYFKKVYSNVEGYIFLSQIITTIISFICILLLYLYENKFERKFVSNFDRKFKKVNAL